MTNEEALVYAACVQAVMARQLAAAGGGWPYDRDVADAAGQLYDTCAERVGLRSLSTLRPMVEQPGA